MPQEIRVLRCFNCDLFQTDIVKKSNKWQCKVCDTKQSVRREYVRGCGATCRAKVRELTMKIEEEQGNQNDNMLEVLNSTEMDDYDWESIDSVENAGAQWEFENSDKTNDLVNDRDENKKEQMFNYACTKPWCRSIDADSNTTNNAKKSKWESFM